MDENDDITDNVQFTTFVRGADHAFLFLRILLVYILQRHCNWRRFDGCHPVVFINIEVFIPTKTQQLSVNDNVIG